VTRTLDLRIKSPEVKASRFSLKIPPTLLFSEGKRCVSRERFPGISRKNPQKYLHPDLRIRGFKVAKVKFTAPKVDAFKCPAGKGQAFIWDSDTPGLGLRATPKGANAYVFQSRFNGKDLRITLGAADVWPLNSRMDRVGPGGKVAQLGAREEARRLQSLIDMGRDPREVRAQATAADVAKRALAQRHAVTVGEAWRAYLADRKPHWGDRHFQDHEDLAHAGGAVRKRSKAKTKPGPLAGLMGHRLSDLTAEKLERWAAKEAATRPARARLALRLIKAFLKWCDSMAAYQAAVNADAAKSKRVREKLGSATKRSTALRREQLPAWFAAVRAIPNPVVSAYLHFMLIAGPRPNEPVWLKWSDADFQWKTISLRDKIEGKRQIGLTPYLASLLASLPRRNEWIFSSRTSASGRIVETAADHDAACDAAGLPRITLQGLRRSFASLCEWIEVPAGISAQIQGHAPQGVREQNYIRRPVDLLQMWHEKIEAWILKEAGINFKPRAKR
jgi:integrase